MASDKMVNIMVEYISKLLRVFTSIVSQRLEIVDRKRVVTACIIVTGLGTIISIVGMMIASGIDQGGNLYDTLYTAFMVFWVLSIVSIAFYPDPSKAEQNQSQAEMDSSLV